MLDNLTDALSPIIVDAAVSIIMAAFTWLSVKASQYLTAKQKLAADQMVNLLIDRLHMALESGVAQSPVGAPVDVIVSGAVEYAERSVPDAIEKLGAKAGNVLADLARAKVRQAVGR